MATREMDVSDVSLRTWEDLSLALKLNDAIGDILRIYDAIGGVSWKLHGDGNNKKKKEQRRWNIVHN